MRRRHALLVVAVLAAGVAVMQLTVNAARAPAARTITASSTPSAPAATPAAHAPVLLPAAASAVPAACRPAQLAVGGAFNDCAQQATDHASYCSLSLGSIDDVITMHGMRHDFVLYLAVHDEFTGPGDYPLHADAAGMDAGFGAALEVREDGSGTLYQAVTGMVHVSHDAAGGTVHAQLAVAGGQTPAPAAMLALAGAWTC